MWHRLNFLSINRFERKKNIELAVSAFARLHTLEEHALQSQKLNEATLTIAGKSQFASFLGYITKEFHILMSLENGFCTWDAVFSLSLYACCGKGHVPSSLEERGREGLGSTCTFTKDF
jgi:hypothetical protein